MNDRHSCNRSCRTLALVPGMREIGYAQALGPLGPSAGVIRWGVRSLPRGVPARTRVHLAQRWLQGIIFSEQIDQVVVILPDVCHVSQRKNPTKLKLMVRGLRHQVERIGSPVIVRHRKSLKTWRGKPKVPPSAPRIPRRARWAFAALTLPEQDGSQARSRV